MDRRAFLGRVGLAAVSLAAGGRVAVGQEGRGKRPNFVLVMADDQGWGDVGYNGHEVLKTPNLDAMAGAGVRFDRFYAAAPVCSPTRVSVLTGRHPNRCGVFSWGHVMRPQEVTLAAVLQKAGYRTGHFGKWHVGSVFKGSPVNPGALGFDEWVSAPNFYENDPIMSDQGEAVRLAGESSVVTAEAAIEFMRASVGREAPFLAVVWFGSPHLPHEAAEEFGAAYEGAGKDYYGEIAGIDFAVGRLRAELRRLGIEGETVVWYCSDNGGKGRVSVKGGRGQKGEIYEGGLRVPAVLEWPGRVGHRVVAMPCNTSDIFPTVVELAGAEVGHERPMDGVSLVGAVEGRMRERPGMGFWQRPRRGVITRSGELMAELLERQRRGEEFGEAEWLHLDAGRIERRDGGEELAGHAAWLEWPWKLHRKEAEGEVEVELYDLGADAGEERDLAGLEGERVAGMRGRLEGWMRSVVGSLDGGDY